MPQEPFSPPLTKHNTTSTQSGFCYLGCLTPSEYDAAAVEPGSELGGVEVGEMVDPIPEARASHLPESRRPRCVRLSLPPTHSHPQPKNRIKFIIKSHKQVSAEGTQVTQGIVELKNPDIEPHRPPHQHHSPKMMSEGRGRSSFTSSSPYICRQRWPCGRPPAPGLNVANGITSASDDGVLRYLGRRDGHPPNTRR